MSQVKQITVWIITAMAGVLIVWNFSKAVSEMYGSANMLLRLRRIRIAGNSGSTNFSNRTPVSSR